MLKQNDTEVQISLGDSKDPLVQVAIPYGGWIIGHVYKNYVLKT